MVRPPPPLDLSHELTVACALAADAAAAILKVRDQARANPTEKPAGEGPVTAADLAADGVIRTGLTSEFPRDLVVTEETWTAGATIPAAPRAWFVDPLDGTSDFVKGNADYAVMIGLCAFGEPVLGVLLQPETGVLWRGLTSAEGKLCERVERDGSVVDLTSNKRPLPKEGPRAAVSRSHPSKLTNEMLHVLGGGSVVRKGSVGLKAALIADGLADLYLSGSRRIKVWDTAGPAAILRSIGADMTALDGTPLVYDAHPAHGAGIRAWTKAAERAIQPRLDEAIRGWRARQR